MMIWWLSDKAHERHMLEIRRMYESNVRLVEAYEQLSKAQQALAEDLKDVVILNTQVFTEACAAIKSNQFCPMVRLKKQASGREE